MKFKILNSGYFFEKEYYDKLKDFHLTISAHHTKYVSSQEFYIEINSLEELEKIATNR